MQEYTVITVPQDLLPQVVGELLQFAMNPDHVDVYHGLHGREIHAHPEVANAWYQARQQRPGPAPVPAQDAAPEPAQGSTTATETPSVSDSGTKAPAVTPPPSPAPPQSQPSTASKSTTSVSEKRTPSA